MVIVLLHHIGQVLLPPGVKILYIVVQRFVDIPVIDIFIHHKHSQPVTDFQSGFRAGIMG